MSDIAEKAWNETRNPSDPLFSAIPEREFKENLEFRAQKVKETGIANTNFEKKVAQLLASDEFKDSGPMATSGAVAGVDLDAAAEGLVEKSAEEKAAVKKADDDARQAEIEAHESAIKALKAKDDKDEKPKADLKDQSGHVPTATEKAATAKEAKIAPAK